MLKSSMTFQGFAATVERLPVIKQSSSGNDYAILVVTAGEERGGPNKGESTLHEIIFFFEETVAKVRGLTPGTTVHIAGEVGSRVNNDFINASLKGTHIHIHPEQMLPVAATEAVVPATPAPAEPAAATPAGAEDDDDLPF